VRAASPFFMFPPSGQEPRKGFAEGISRGFVVRRVPFTSARLRRSRRPESNIRILEFWNSQISYVISEIRIFQYSNTRCTIVQCPEDNVPIIRNIPFASGGLRHSCRPEILLEYVLHIFSIVRWFPVYCCDFPANFLFNRNSRVRVWYGHSVPSDRLEPRAGLSGIIVGQNFCNYLIIIAFCGVNLPNFL